MNIDNLEYEVCQAVRQKVSAAYDALIGEITTDITKAKENEKAATKPEDKEFFRGVHVGMTDVVIKLNVAKI